MPPGPLRPRCLWSEIPDAPGMDKSWRYDFRTGMPDARLFPYQRWRGLIARELAGQARSARGRGTLLPEGPRWGPWRAAIARHVGIARSVHATADEVIVTNGIQQALDLIARVLLEPGRPSRSRIPATRRRAGCCDDGLASSPCRSTTRASSSMPSRRPRRPRHAVAPVPARHRCRCAAGWRCSAGPTARCRDHRGRLRQRVPLRRPPDRAAAEPRRQRSGPLRRVVLEDDAAVAAARLPGRAARRCARRCRPPSTSPTGTPRCPARPHWRRSSTSGALSAHIRRMRRVYAQRHEVVMRFLSGELTPWLTVIQTRPACTYPR